MTDTINQVRGAATFLLERLDDFDRAGDNMTEDGQRDWYGHVLPALSRVRTALSHPAPDVPKPTFREIRPEEVTFGRHRDVPSADEVEAIRRRHEAADKDSGHEWAGLHADHAHTDRATLLDLLDAARAELAEVREAAGPWLMWANELDDDRPDDEPVSSLISAGEYRRLAAALAKDAT